MSNDYVSLIIFAICVILFVWDKLPMATTALMGCAAMVIFGVCEFKTAFGQLASNTVVLTVGVMIIGASISETGLAAIIGEWIVKVSGGSERKLIFGTYIVAAFMSAFLTNSAVLAMFIPIVMGVSRTNSKIKSLNIFMPIAMACLVGGASTLVGSTQQLTTQGLLEEEGIRMFKMFDFTLVGGIILLIGLIYCIFIGYRRGEKIWGDRQENMDIEIKKNNLGYQKSKQIIMSVIFIITAVLYITEWIPLAVTSTSAAVACIITGCITQDKAVKAVNWNIAGRLAGCLGLSKALDEAGGTQIIADFCGRIIGEKMSPYILFAILVLIVQLASQVMVNSTAILIVFPVVLALASTLNLNVYTYALGITLASAMTMSCPLSSSALGMSMTVGYKFKDYFRYGVIFDVLAYITIITLVPLFYALTN